MLILGYNSLPQESLRLHDVFFNRNNKRKKESCENLAQTNIGIFTLLESF